MGSNPRFRIAHASGKKFLDIQATYRVWFTLELVRDMIITYKWNLKKGVHIFTKIKKTEGWKKRKKYFSFFVTEFLYFSYKRFFRKWSMFRRSIPSTHETNLVNLIFERNLTKTLCPLETWIIAFCYYKRKAFVSIRLKLLN